jgi:hypothetical protein
MSRRLVFMFLLSTGMFCAQAQPTYPVVSKSEQKARDDDRRPLLDSELAFEGEALERAKTEFVTEPTNERVAAVHRHQENIEALQRELGAVGLQEVDEKRERPVAKAVRQVAHAVDSKRTPNFWDPYNRTPDPVDFSISPTRNSHE